MRIRRDFVMSGGSAGDQAEDRTNPRHVAVVGAGRWGRIMCRVLTGLRPPIPVITMVAQSNHDDTIRWLSEPSSGLEKRERISVVSALDDVLVGPTAADAALVTKRASDHFEATFRLLSAGVHVLVEKPFVLNPVQAATLVGLARERDLTLAVGYELMFSRPHHLFREAIAERGGSVCAVRFVWHDVQGDARWGVPKQPDYSANVITDLYPHILSQLRLLFGDQTINLLRVASADGCWAAELELRCGETPVTVSLRKDAARRCRTVDVMVSGGERVRLDYSEEPGRVYVNDQPAFPDSSVGVPPSSLASELTYFFRRTRRPHVELPNAAERTLNFVDETARAEKELVAEQVDRLRPTLWADAPTEIPDHVVRVLRHHLVDPLVRHRVVEGPKDTDGLNRSVAQAFRIVHRLSRQPFTTQSTLLASEGLGVSQLVRLNAAMRDSPLVQRLMTEEGTARKYWGTIIPLVETGALATVLDNTYRFPLRLGVYAAVSCMFSCNFCGRMENPDARYSGRDVEPGNELFRRTFELMPVGASTLSLGGGLEPLTNPRLDDVIRAAKACGHRVPLVTNGFMLTPTHVARHEAFWDVDILRLSLYGVDETSYQAVTKKRGAFDMVTSNVVAFLRERARRGGGPKVGFNFVVQTDAVDQVLKTLDVIADIDEACGGHGVDFLTLREDFSIPQGEGLSPDERHRLVTVFEEFADRRHRELPGLSVDFGYALYPLSEGVVGPGLAMVDHTGMLPKAYPQISVAIDLLGDVYLYRDAAFPDRPGVDRCRIGAITTERSLEDVVRTFLETGTDIESQPHDPAVMDAFDHVVTKLVHQANADRRTGIPFELGPVAARTFRSESDRSGPPAAEGIAVNYWQALYGA